MPQVISKILEIDENHIEISVEELRVLISSDAAIASKIVKLANSPFYSRGNSVTDLGQAIKLLGFKSIKSLTLLVSIANTIPKVNNDLSVQKELWLRSIMSSIVAKYIAAKSGQSKIQEAIFISSLLRNIGQLILHSRFPNNYEKIFFACNKGADQEEQMKRESDDIGVNFRELSAYTMEKWNFPQEFILVSRTPIDTPEVVDKISGITGLYSVLGEIIVYKNRLTEMLEDAQINQEYYDNLFNEYIKYIGFDEKVQSFISSNLNTIFSDDEFYSFCNEIYSI